VTHPDKCGWRLDHWRLFQPQAQCQRVASLGVKRIALRFRARRASEGPAPSLTLRALKALRSIRQPTNPYPSYLCPFYPPLRAACHPWNRAGAWAFLRFSALVFLQSWAWASLQIAAVLPILA